MIANLVSDNLIIYGEGEMREELEKRVADLELTERIFLPGAVTDVPNTIKSAKLFVLSSDYEGMPNSLMEAMALGIPCISTDCPCGGPRMILDGKYLSEVNDAKYFSEKILELISSHNNLLEASVYAKKEALQFSSEKVLENWKKFFIEIISKKYNMENQ